MRGHHLLPVDSPHKDAGSISTSLYHHEVPRQGGLFQNVATSLTVEAVYSGADQRKHQSSASLAFVRGIHRWPVNSSHKCPVTRKMFPLDDVIMRWLSMSANWVSIASCNGLSASSHYLNQFCRCQCRLENKGHASFGFEANYEYLKQITNNVGDKWGMFSGHQNDKPKNKCHNDRSRNHCRHHHNITWEQLLELAPHNHQFIVIMMTSSNGDIFRITVRGIHRSPVNFPHKGLWRGALMFSLICAWINDWVNNHREVIWDAIALIMTSP